MTSYVALLADAVASRDLPRARRARLQADLRAQLPRLNRYRPWRPVVAARFAVTLGDELQVLLTGTPPVWDIAHAIRRLFPEVDWTVACGRGPLTTPLHDGATAPELDGPCFHEARTALQRAKADRLLFAFGGFDDPRLDGAAAYYSALYWSWTARQRREATRWRWTVPAGRSLTPEARAKIHPSAISHLRRRMAWPLVEAGDRMFRALLEDAR
ncbi:MAG: SatD family protein [Gemmatimonadales bacterium]